MAKHLAGWVNQHAYHLSRLALHYEWQLHPRVLKLLDNRWGRHTVDQFASLLTAQLPRYNSMFYDSM